MTFGNHIDHIASDVLAGKSRDELAAGLFNVFFREGTHEEREAAMVREFARRGVIARLEDGLDARGNPAEWVRFRPA